MNRKNKIFKSCFLSFVLAFTSVAAPVMGDSAYVAQAAAKMKISAKKATVKVGATKTLKISGTNKKVTWSSSKKSVARVNSKGKVTAWSPGKATITGKVSGKKFSCTVTVPSVQIDSTELELVAGDVDTLTITGVSQSVKWTSANQKVAKVASKGKYSCKVTGVAEGETTISAKVCGTTLKCKVSVEEEDIDVEEIQLDKETATLEVGDTLKLNATVTPSNATDKTVEWESDDEDIAEVSEDGTVTAIAEGTVDITATAGDVEAICTITVVDSENSDGEESSTGEEEEIEVTGIKLDKDTADLKIGDVLTLKATVTPEDATDKTVEWSSSNEAVAKVSSTGRVTAISKGTAKIIAVAGEKSAICSITVSEEEIQIKEIEVTDIKLDKNAADLKIGDTITLSATVTPDNATDKTVEWSSSNEAVAKVSASGEVTALSEGTARIIATAGEKSAICTITVTQNVIGVSAVTLDKQYADMKVGDTLTLKATITPNNVTDNTVTWSSSNSSVATVSSSGKVTAISKGTAQITATAGGKKAICTVVVQETKSSYDILYDYIQKSGETGDDGIKQVTYTEYYENNMALYGIRYDEENDRFELTFAYVSSDGSGNVKYFVMGLMYIGRQGSKNSEFYFGFTSNTNNYYCNGIAPVTLSSYTKDTALTFSFTRYGSASTQSFYNELGSTTLKTAMFGWNQLLNGAGLDLASIGFTSYQS